MNYITKPISRNEIRALSNWFRLICGYTNEEAINPIELLDKIQDIDFFNNLCYEIVYNNELDKAVPAECTYDGYIFNIKVKESTYIKAYNNIGGCRMHIMHEISHVFLYKLGYTPYNRGKILSEVPIFQKIEWIAKALAGEIMMPYDFTKDLSIDEIMSKYGVSKDAATKRKKY